MKIAIFGAGQLAMMMIEASSDLGHEFIVIDPASRPPASEIAKHYMVGYNDEEILKVVVTVMNGLSMITTELQKYLSYWEKYKSLWELDKDNFIRKYAKQNRPLSQYDIDIHVSLIRLAES